MDEKCLNFYFHSIIILNSTMEFSYKDGETHPKKGKNKEEIESNI